MIGHAPAPGGTLPKKNDVWLPYSLAVHCARIGSSEDERERRGR